MLLHYNRVGEIIPVRRSDRFVYSPMRTVFVAEESTPENVVALVAEESFVEPIVLTPES